MDWGSVKCTDPILNNQCHRVLTPRCCVSLVWPDLAAGISVLGMPKTLRIWEQWYPKHGDTQNTEESEFLNIVYLVLSRIDRLFKIPWNVFCYDMFFTISGISVLWKVVSQYRSFPESLNDHNWISLSLSLDRAWVSNDRSWSQRSLIYLACVHPRTQVIISTRVYFFPEFLANIIMVRTIAARQLTLYRVNIS